MMARVPDHLHPHYFYSPLSIMNFVNLWQEEGEPWELALDHIIEAKKFLGNLLMPHHAKHCCCAECRVWVKCIIICMEFRPGSNVVISSLNFPTGVFSFHALRSRGLIKEVRIARSVNGYVPLEEYERLIDDNTVVVFVDYVSWITGGYRERVRGGIAEIAHARGGAVLISDAFHAVGVLPIDVTKDGVDALITGSYKWLLGPHGAGFVYVSDELLSSLSLRYRVGWGGLMITK